MIVSFLSDRESFVVVNGIKSFSFSPPAGVPQGSPLSPRLFNVFINDIPVPKNCKLAIFADDTALLASISNYDLPLLVDRMESGLKEIQNHFTSWKMKLNSSKTETILFTQSRKMTEQSQSLPIKFNDEPLEWKKYVKYLGVLLDSKLTLKLNIENNVKKSKKSSSSALQLVKEKQRRSGKVKGHTLPILYQTNLDVRMSSLCQYREIPSAETSSATK